jgi:hypothetical protein
MVYNISFRRFCGVDLWVLSFIILRIYKLEELLLQNVIYDVQYVG